MGMKLFKEVFTGKYDGVAPPIGLPQGSVVGGSNMRKVSPMGGWKARKGCVYHNTTSLGAYAVKSLHQYSHPRNADYHFLAQCNGKLYDASSDPPAAGTTFAASELSSLASSTQPGFSDVVDETFVYADGSGAPVMWGGDNPFCSALLIYDDTSTSYADYTRNVRDEDTTTYAIAIAASTSRIYVCSPCPAKGIVLTLGSSVSTQEDSLVVQCFTTEWTSVSGKSDGTSLNGAPLGQSGTITWTTGTTEKMIVIGGIMGYWYRLSQEYNRSGVVHITSCKIQYNPARITNKWTGVYELPLAVRVQYTGAAATNYTGKVTNQSTSMYIGMSTFTSAEYMYIKTVEPIFSIAFGVVEGYENVSEILWDNLDWWTGSAWTTITDLVDGTTDGDGAISLAQSGILSWQATGIAPVKRTWDFDTSPGYWYRLSASGTFSADCRVFFIAVGGQPESLRTYDGVVEFKGRAVYWGDKEFPNRLRYSAYLRLDHCSGSDSGWTRPFGKTSKLVCAKRFYNELIVWKADSVWLLEGYDPKSFGILNIASTVGCCAPATVHVVEAGFAQMHADESLTVAIWMDTDGIYIIDGRKPKKVSLPVDHFFNPESASCISAANLANCQAFVDRNNNEYHLLIPDGRELVYNYVTGEWYPPWDRQVGTAAQYLVCGLCFRGTDGRFYTYGGNDDGEVFRLENDTTDKSEANADVAITHSIKTRAICADPQLSTAFEFFFRQVQLEAKARSAGTVVVNFYKNLATTPIVLATPAAPTLINSGYGLTVDGVDTSQDKCVTFQLEFQCATADVELELWSFLYQVDAVGEIALG